MTENVGGYLLTDMGVYPDERCDAVAVTTSLRTGDRYETRCALHHEHDPQSQPHTDGAGAFWDDDGEVEYR